MFELVCRLMGFGVKAMKQNEQQRRSSLARVYRLLIALVEEAEKATNKDTSSEEAVLVAEETLAPQAQRKADSKHSRRNSGQRTGVDDGK